MKNCNAPENQTTRRILLIACATALAVAFTVSLPQLADADRVTPPPVPANIRASGEQGVPGGHADGTQNYICVPCPNPTTSMCPDVLGFAWMLSSRRRPPCSRTTIRQVITHFFSPNPFENNTNPGVVAADMIRATWRESRDTSTVWAKTNQSSSDSAFVEPGAIAWLLLEVVGAQDGPTGGDKLTVTTFIQRLNTSGGVAPPMGCTLSTDVGAEAFVPYTADYFFCKKAAKSDADDGN
jgi:hypothetical protein